VGRWGKGGGCGREGGGLKDQPATFCCTLEDGEPSMWIMACTLAAEGPTMRWQVASDTPARQRRASAALAWISLDLLPSSMTRWPMAPSSASSFCSAATSYSDSCSIAFLYTLRGEEHAMGIRGKGWVVVGRGGGGSPRERGHGHEGTLSVSLE